VTLIELRLARRDDLSELEALASAAIDRLLRPFLDESQLAASTAIMGVDAQLIDDGTYVVADCHGSVVGCGGWSRRRTLYGTVSTAGRDDGQLDPKTEPARVRAMYTHPDAARRGVGRRVLQWCEDAARSEGFARLELVATMAGAPLYAAAGFAVDAPFDDTSTGIAIPLLRMSKTIERSVSSPIEQPKETTAARRARAGDVRRRAHRW
jgi:GNAT superfamily N-acetyltransferase